jgi:hypothetical protein
MLDIALGKTKDTVNPVIDREKDSEKEKPTE